MTSEVPPREAREAYVWIWLPNALEPVVAGRLAREGDRLVFNYGRSYLARPDAIPLYEPDLPLRAGTIPPAPGQQMAGCLRDAAPDAWGRRVILNRLAGRAGPGADVAELDELTYLLESGSDRIGALDFQRSADRHAPRLARSATLAELLAAAERIERGQASFNRPEAWQLRPQAPLGAALSRESLSLVSLALPRPTDF